MRESPFRNDSRYGDARCRDSFLCSQLRSCERKLLSASLGPILEIEMIPRGTASSFRVSCSLRPVLGEKASGRAPELRLKARARARSTREPTLVCNLLPDHNIESASFGQKSLARAGHWRIEDASQSSSWEKLTPRKCSPTQHSSHCLSHHLILHFSSPETLHLPRLTAFITANKHIM